MTNKVKRRVNRDSYFDLVRQFPLCPIRSDEELEEAIEMVDVLIDSFGD